MSHDLDRRAFVGTLASLTGAAVLPAATLDARARDAGPAAAQPWDLRWLDAMKGKHRQLFDLGTRDIGATANPLNVVRNYLDAHREVYGLAHPDVDTIVGIARSAFPINAADGFWEKYALGERWKIRDPATGAWATRNVYLDDVPAERETGVRSLVSRGTIFWQCNNALGSVVRQLAEATKTPPEQVRAEAIANLLPHVHLVPAHTMLVGLAQERRCTYEKL